VPIALYFLHLASGTADICGLALALRYLLLRLQFAVPAMRSRCEFLPENSGTLL